MRHYWKVAVPGATLVYVICAGVATSDPHWTSDWHPLLAAFCACAVLVGAGIIEWLAKIESRSHSMPVTPEERAVIESLRKDTP